MALGAQETAFTLARGMKLAVDCQLGVTAAAGRLETGTPTTLNATIVIVASAMKVIPRMVSNATTIRRR